MLWLQEKCEEEGVPPPAWVSAVEMPSNVTDAIGSAVEVRGGVGRGREATLFLLRRLCTPIQLPVALAPHCQFGGAFLARLITARCPPCSLLPQATAGRVATAILPHAPNAPTTHASYIVEAVRRRSVTLQAGQAEEGAKLERLVIHKANEGS